MSIYKYIVRKKEQQAVGTNTRSHAFLNLDQVKNVMILFDGKDIGQIIRIAKDLKSTGKNVSLWTTISRNENMRPTKEFEDISLRIITPKEKSRFMILSGNVLNEFKQQECDMLLDMSESKNVTISYLMANTDCSFCVGIKEPDFPVYDFIYLKDPDQNLVDAFEQIKIYLTRYVTRSK